MNPNRLLFIQIQTLLPSLHHKRKEAIGFCVKNTQFKIIRDQLPMNSTIELKDNDNEAVGCLASSPYPGGAVY